MLASKSKERKKEQTSLEKYHTSAFKADRITSERIRCECIPLPIYYSDLPNGFTVHNLGGRTGKILRPSSVTLKSKNQEINRLQLALKLPWAIFFESVDILS
ncbi:hypothetical protein TNCV_1794251 [Trichonephila clavipes]|nr:hypothetical protein TNCV_1794251 [Trichonephila clavipes]